MKIVAAIFAAFYLAYFQDVSAEIKVLQKSHVELTKRLVFDRNSYVDGQLTYALCDKNLQADEIKCTVFREKKPYGDDSYSCDVTLKRAANHGVEFTAEIKLIPFGKNNVALTMMETGSGNIDPHVNFKTVQMDSCKVSETAIDTKAPISSYNFEFVGHSDSYDVFYRNGKVSCGAELCKATIDADGKLVYGPKSSIGELAFHTGLNQVILPLDDNNSKYGYFYFKAFGRGYIYTLLKNDGTEKSLGTPSDRNTKQISAATNNKLIGVCYPIDKDYKCNQYDFDGNSKLETTLFKLAENMNMWDIYNLPTGGFYTVSSTFGENIQYFVERVDSNGNRSGSFELQGLGKHKQDEYYRVPVFYQNDNKETCVSLLAYDSRNSNAAKEGDGHLYLTGNCFTDADFSK